MSSSVRLRAPVQHRRKSTLQPTKDQTSEAASLPSDIGSWPSARCAGAPAGSGWPHDHDNRSHQELQQGPGRPRRLVALRTRDHHRFPRGQRRRQVHHAEDDRRAGATRSRHGDHRRPTVRRAAQPDPCGRDAARRVGDASRAQWPGDAHDRSAAGRRSHETGRVPVGPRRDRRCRGQAGGDLLTGHAPAPRRRPGPRR